MVGDQHQQGVARSSRCDRAREWASLRVDDEISDVEKLLLRRHLARCQECTAFARNIEGVTAMIRHSELQEPEREVTPAAQPVARKGRMRLRLGLALVVIAAGLGALAGFLRNDSGTGDPAGPGPAQISQLPPAQLPAPATPDEPPVEPDEGPIAPV